jgi:hypothetical protein
MLFCEVVKQLVGGIHFMRFSSYFLQSNQFPYWKYTFGMVTKKGEDGILEIFPEHVFPFGSEQAPGGKDQVRRGVFFALSQADESRAREFRAKSDEKAFRD